MSDTQRLDDARRFLLEMAEILGSLESRQDKLLTLRDYGEQLSPMPPDQKTSENHVPGCASPTYIALERDADGRVQYVADSESFISKGYLYILVQALNGCTPEQVVTAFEDEIETFADQSGVRLSMIASRANVLERIYRFMQKKALSVIPQEQST
jgi:cysteine desulfuration protein SufE